MVNKVDSECNCLSHYAINEIKSELIDLEIKCIRQQRLIRELREMIRNREILIEELTETIKDLSCHD